LIVGGIFFSITTQKLEEEYIEEVKRGGIRLSDSIKNSFRYAMLQDDKKAVLSAVQSVGKQKEIDRLRVYNKDGVIMFSSVDREIGRLIDKHSKACAPCHRHSQPLKHLTELERCSIYNNDEAARSLLLINPIYNGTDCSTAACHAHDPHQRVLGVMDLSMSLQIVDSELAQKKRLFSSFAIGLMVITSLVIFLVMRRVVRPITSLVAGTKRISSGDLDHPLEVKTKDEIGMLADSFNTMTNNLKTTRNQLLQSERLASLGRMAAGIAHEINNPLTGIMMFTSSLQDEQKGEDGELSETLDVIMTETKRCREIIRGLLDFARQRQSNYQVHSILDILKNSLKIISSHVQAAGIEVVTRFDASIPAMLVDGIQLEQVFLNLMINAIDAMPDGGTLTIRATMTSDDEAGISVSDSGTGITPENISHVFEPFFSTKGTKGTGLGLAVSWGIIDQHHGTITVESEVNKGTTFTVKLPVSREER
jgi:two-component system, NtrC family, sensor kinase